MARSHAPPVASSPTAESREHPVAPGHSVARPVRSVAWQETAQTTPSPRGEDRSKALPPPKANSRTDEELLPRSPEASRIALPDNGGALTLDELLQLAVDANPTLGQAYAQVRQAQGNWLQAGLYPNPNIEWFDEANNAQFDAHYGTVSQDIVTAQKLRLNRTVARSDVRRARWEAEAQSLRVLNEVRIRHIAALGAQRQVAVAEELLAIAEGGVRSSEQFLKAEQVSEADVLQAELQLNQTLILLRNARFRAAAAWRQLANVVGRPDLPERPLAGKLEEAVADIEWDPAWRQLVENSPVLHAARARARAARAQVRREEVEPIPNLRVTGGSGVDAQRPFNGAPNFPMFFAQLGATVPVFNRNQGNIMAAGGELRASQSEVARLHLSLRDRMADAFQRYQSAQNEVQIYRDMSLPAAERNLMLSVKAYDEGEFDFLRVLVARQSLFEARINYVAALTELRISAIELQGLLLTGGLEPAPNNPVPANSAGQTNGPGK
jgi:cobalt-zinc-cadmium efflux system outer membrane protein